MVDSESGSPVSCSSFLVTICLSLLVSEIFACDRQTDKQTDNADHYYRWPPHCGGPAKNVGCKSDGRVATTVRDVEIRSDALACA